MDTDQLVARAQAGCRDSLAILWGRHYDENLSLACRVVSDQDRAEDIMQTSFLKALCQIHGFNNGSIRSWFSQIVFRSSIDEMIDDNKRRSSEHRAGIQDDGTNDLGGNQEELFSSAQQARWINSLLLSLPRELSVIAHCYLDGHLEGKIGSQLRITKSAVRRRRAKIGRILQKQLERING